MKGERRATCGQEIPTKTRGGRERAGAIAAGIRVKGADLTEDPIDVYSFRHNANSGFLHRSPHILLLFFFLPPLQKSLVLFLSLELTLGLYFVFLPLLFFARVACGPLPS